MALTVVFTWPVSIHADRLLAGTPGDGLGVVWGISWFEKALFQLHQSPLFTTSINFPEGWWLATFDISPAMMIGAIPVSMWLGPVAGYNFVALASFPLSGLVVFVYVRRWTGNWFAALFAGTAFAFSPFRITHYLVGHSGLLQAQWPALYLLSIVRPNNLTQDWLGGCCMACSWARADGADVTVLPIHGFALVGSDACCGCAVE
ncbi:MAG: hypothetical protein WC935_10115 [Thermoleophilia bacterium]